MQSILQKVYGFEQTRNLQMFVNNITIKQKCNKEKYNNYQIYKKCDDAENKQYELTDKTLLEFKQIQQIQNKLKLNANVKVYGCYSNYVYKI